jgi:hypothetical protein
VFFNGKSCHREMMVRVMKGVTRQHDLLHVIAALSSSGRFPSLLNSRQQKRNQQ